MSLTILSTCLTVEEFFTSANWTGKQKQTVVQTVVEADKVEELNLSLNLTVEEFFACHNWQGLRELKPVEEPITSDSVFSLTMTVNDFFAQMLWQGQPTIASPPQKSTQTHNASTPNYQNLNLTELSKLF